jgi:hypothetical protein
MPYYIIDPKTREVFAIEIMKPPAEAYPNHEVAFSSKNFSIAFEGTPADIVAESDAEPEPITLEKLIATLVTKKVITLEELRLSDQRKVSKM